MRSILPYRLVAVSSALVLAFILTFTSSAGALGSGTRAPALGLKDLQGKTVDLESLKGKVVLVDFWASWCAPCKEELPELEKLYKKYQAKGFVIVGVNIDEDAANMTKFLKGQKLSFTVVRDTPDHAVAGRYKPTKMPSSYLIDKKGIVRHVHAGYKAADKAAFDKEISALLAE